MQAHVYLQPLANAHGGYADEIDITDLIVGNLTFGSKPEKNKWGYGVPAAGSTRLRLADRAGRFASETFGGSVFALAGRDNARVRIEYERGHSDPRTDAVWRGLTTSRGTQSSPTDGMSEILVRSVDSVLHEVGIAPGAIPAGIDGEAAIRAPFNVPEISAAIGREPLLEFSDPVPGGFTIRDEAAFIGDADTAADVLNRLFQALDLLLAYDSNAQRTLIFARGA